MEGIITFLFLTGESMVSCILAYGVLQGSALEPLIFTFRTSDIEFIMHAHGLRYINVTVIDAVVFFL